MSKVLKSNREREIKDLSRRGLLRYSRQAALILLYLLLLFIDQWSKIFIIRYFPKFVSINSGGAFGILGGSNYYYLVLCLAIAALAYLFYKTSSQKETWLAYGFIVTGILANLIDRLFRGGVVDFIDIKIWPSFNLADIFMVAGLIWLCLILIRPKRA